MNILRLSTLSLTLAIAVMTLGYVNSSSAAKKDIDCTDPSSHPSCKPSDDSSPSENLSASFCLTIDIETSSLYIESDGDSPTDTLEYCADSKEKVAVGTGSGPGFRFDTNLQNDHRERKFGNARLVFMDITGLTQARVAFEIDFRFDLPSGGLDLGSLAVPDDVVGCPTPGACEGTVAASLRYYAGADVATADFPDQNWGKLGFGAIHANIDDIDDLAHNAARKCLAPESRKIRVTRTGAETWTLESNADGKACRFLLEGSGDAECTNGHACSFDASDEIDFKFKFEL